MNHKELQELIKLVNELEIASFHLVQGDLELKIKSSKYVEAKSAGKATVIQAPAMSMPMQSAPAPVAVPNPVGAPTPATTSSGEKETNAGLIEIKSPMVGTFYRSSSPDKPPYVQVGDEIKPGSPLCIIEAMKLFNEIESEVSGRIVKVLVEDSKPVEYDQPLFLIEPK